MRLSDAISAVREALVNSERIHRLSEEVAAHAGDVQRELRDIHREQRELRDRVARLEGAVSVLGQWPRSTPSAPGEYHE